MEKGTKHLTSGTGKRHNVKQHTTHCRKRHPHKIVWHPPNRITIGATKVDLANERLIRTDNMKMIKGSRSSHQSFRIASLASSNKFSSLLRNRPALTTPTFSCALPKHGVQHRIPTTGFPVHS